MKQKLILNNKREKNIKHAPIMNDAFPHKTSIFIKPIILAQQELCNKSYKWQVIDTYLSYEAILCIKTITIFYHQHPFNNPSHQPI